MRLVGHEPLLPDPFEGLRDEEAIARRMAENRDQVAGLPEEGWEAWRRRRGPRPPRGRDEAHLASQGGKRTRLYLDREKASRSFLGALGLTTRKMENTFAALTAHITNRTFDYDFEHLPVTPPHTDLV